MREEEPTPPADEISTPATFPARLFIKFVAGAWLSSSPFTSCVAYPKDDFFLSIPRAVTTTSFRSDAATLSWMVKFFLLPTATSRVSNPIIEIVRTASSGTVNLNLPAASVMTPCEVPLICIETPCKGVPFSSVTIPATSCCKNKVSLGEIITRLLSNIR